MPTKPLSSPRRASSPKRPRYRVAIAAHPVQVAIAQMVADTGIDDLTLREVGAACGAASPQQVKHHLGQLVRYGFLDIVAGRYRLGRALNTSLPTGKAK